MGSACPSVVRTVARRLERFRKVCHHGPVVQPCAWLCDGGTPWNLLFCLIGVILGTLIGVLPGIGATATTPCSADHLPARTRLGVIMLAGIYYGAQYGGSTTRSLSTCRVKAPQPSPPSTEYQLARKGKAGTAPCIAALASFLRHGLDGHCRCLCANPHGCRPPVGAAEYASLMLLALSRPSRLAHGSIPKALAMVVLGLLLAIVVSTDIYTGVPRLISASPPLLTG